MEKKKRERNENQQNKTNAMLCIMHKVQKYNCIPYRSCIRHITETRKFIKDGNCADGYRLTTDERGFRLKGMSNIYYEVRD